MTWGTHGVGWGWYLWGVWGQEVLEGVWGVKVSVQKVWDVGCARILGKCRGEVEVVMVCTGSTHAGQAVGKKMGDWCRSFGGSGQRGGLGRQRRSALRPPIRWVQPSLSWPESPWVPLRVRILHQDQTLREVHANITVEVKPSIPLRVPAAVMPRHG